MVQTSSNLPGFLKHAGVWPGEAKRQTYARASSSRDSDSREGEECLKEDMHLMYGKLGWAVKHISAENDAAAMPQVDLLFLRNLLFYHC